MQRVPAPSRAGHAHAADRACIVIVKIVWRTNGWRPTSLGLSSRSGNSSPSAAIPPTGVKLSRSGTTPSRLPTSLVRAARSASLITAALLHDIGHLLHHLPDRAPDEGVDDLHEQLAGRWLARWFAPEVVEPIRLHVDAKRDLCAVEPGYRETLSPPSVVSLALQGGPMTKREAQIFRESPHASAAVALRLWDDAAKDPTLEVAGLDEYLPYIEEALAAVTTAAQSAR